MIYFCITQEFRLFPLFEDLVGTYVKTAPDEPDIFTIILHRTRNLIGFQPTGREISVKFL